ncbi:ORFS362W [Human betaherpesvirus 5]|nr:ORFS362W [Human betaherpesvirus 5]QHX40731.1 ORFS362W [Human betaherpesvirus 5]
MTSTSKTHVIWNMCDRKVRQNSTWL